jgi:hypothetical protein
MNGFLLLFWVSLSSPSYHSDMGSLHRRQLSLCLAFLSTSHLASDLIHNTTIDLDDLSVNVPALRQKDNQHVHLLIRARPSAGTSCPSFTFSSGICTLFRSSLPFIAISLGK